MSNCLGCGAPPVPNRRPGPQRKWCSERCRKTQYTLRQPCVDCGAPTSYGPLNGYANEPRCRTCSGAHARIWTREAIVCAIQEWASIHGEAPAAGDWNAWACRNQYHDEERARRYETEKDRWPSHDSVYRAFGSWNTAIEAAGFTARAPHGGDGNIRRQRRLRVAA